ncbi:Smr domain-containing protein [Chitinophaga costaii]|uniref:Smr domain-containing protein n=1 Tax=Chitinophaga costaii TaxID=1335309 RepID=A0A1C4G3I8_9BACT|nr:Smr/MutS family protein [Chitinophaga costaii]PUZ20997.1 hypothetical protein DCM91_17790 [Chitinophaga costaii]SCC62716.1 Smr domain-containing protein [Chitinophaga costaii]
MKYEIGDQIILLHSKEEGRVIDIINDKMVMVEIGKVQFPVYLDQIDFPYFHRFSQKKTLPSIKPNLTRGEELKKEKMSGQIRMEKGVMLSLLPVYAGRGMEEEVELLKFHLLNENATAYNFSFQIYLNHHLHLEIRNTILPFSNFYLADLLFEHLNDAPRFEFTFSLKEPDPKLAPTFLKTWKMKPKQLFQQLNDLHMRQGATLSFPLFDKYPDKPVAPDFDLPAYNSHSVNSITLQLKPKEQPKQEIDLHIDKLTEDWKGLTNLEILGMQLNEFQHYLDLAIAHHQPSLIVIHGVGKGKLRDEIHSILRLTREVNYFVNQYHPKYGYGATEISFKK